jgi:membrane protease subunit HflC
MTSKAPFIALGILAFLGLNSAYIVQQYQKALVLQFGDPVQIESTPGLHFKVPFVQNVVFFDSRVLNLNADEKEINVYEVDSTPAKNPEEIATAENPETMEAEEQTKTEQVLASQPSGETVDENERLIRIIVDAYAKYRIVDPLKFYQSVTNETGLRNRMDAVIESGLKEVLGGVYLTTLLSDERSGITEKILNIVAREGKGFGIDVIDVRIKRVELPVKNREKIYERMRSSKDKEAARLRAEGDEQAIFIKASAQKESTILLAEAQRDAQIIRGEGDATASRIFANAFGKDPSFFSFYRSMQAYRKGLDKNSTSMILSPDSEFLEYLRKLD